MTLEAPYDGSHPVTGTRQFGYEARLDGSYNFFVRSVDRFSSNTQENLKNFVNSTGGMSTVIEPVHSRPDWEKVQEVLQGLRPISDLGCD